MNTKHAEYDRHIEDIRQLLEAHRVELGHLKALIASLTERLELLEGEKQ